MFDLDMEWIAVPLVLIVATAGAWGRRRRIGRWKRLLQTPTAKALQELKIPPGQSPFPWLRNAKSSKSPPTNPLSDLLPPGHKLFDFLYSHHRADAPRQRDPLLVALAQVTTAPETPSQSRAGDGAKLMSGPGAPPALTTEDQVKSLLSATEVSGAFVPGTAFAENALINLVKVLRGKKQLSLGLEHAVLDSLGAAGGLAGSKFGGAVGLISVSWLAGMALPFVALLVPASILVGGLLGALLGKRAGGWFKGWRYLIALRRMQTVCRRFQKWFIGQFPLLIQNQQEEFRRAAFQTQALLKTHQSRLLRWLWPDLRTVFLRQCVGQLDADWKKERRRLETIRDGMKRLGPLRLAALLEELGREGARLSPEAQRETPELWEHARAYAVAVKTLRQLGAVPEKRRESDPPAREAS